MKSRIKNIFMILSFALLIITMTIEKPIRSEAATQDGTYYFSTSMTTKFQVKNNKLTLKVSKNDDSGITKKAMKIIKNTALK